MSAVKKRQNADVRKPDIIRNYHEVIMEEGIEGASIGRVAKKMHIHPSLIIHYFQNKDNLTVALVDYIIHESGEIYQKLSVKTDDPEQRLHNLIEIFFSDEWYAMTDIGADFAVLSLCRRNERVNSRIRNMYGILKMLLAGELEQLIAGGIMLSGDPGRMADLVITMYEGYRHFKHFIVDDNQANSFRKDMVRTVVDAVRKQ